MFIQSNIEGTQAYLNLTKVDSKFNKSLQKISTGMEVSKPSFGGGKFAIANDMEAMYREHNVGAQNVQDAIGLLETFSTAMIETNEIMLEMNDIAYRASTDLLNTAQRRDLDVEFVQLRTQVQNLLSDLTFNGLSLFSVGMASRTFSITYGESAYMKISTRGMSLISLGMGTAAATRHVSTQVLANVAIGSLKGGIDRLNQRMAYIGAEINGIENKVNLINEQAVQLKSMEARVNELDFAKEMKNFTSLQIVMQASNAMIAQANMKSQMVLQLFGG